MDMKIYGSTQYVDLKEQKEPWYQLSVINQWDWSTKAVCYDYAGDTLIKYCLKYCTPVSEDSYKTEKIETLTEEMEKSLIDGGYTISAKKE